MRPSEQKAKEYYELRGYTVLKDGWPDFLVYKTVNGQKDIRAVEVKLNVDAVRPNQQENHRILNMLGVPVDIHWVGRQPSLRRKPGKALKDPRKCRCGKPCEKWQRCCLECWSHPNARE